MTKKALESYGMKLIAKVSLANHQFKIEITDAAAADLKESIYAFLFGGEIPRIGSSGRSLRSRLRDWERDVSRRLQGRESRTPQYEADEWKRLYEEHGEGELYARQATEVETPVGRFRAYLDEERVLIARHDPSLCHDKRHHRSAI